MHNQSDMLHVHRSEYLSNLRPDFTSKLVHILAFGTPKFYIAPYDKIKHKLVNLSSNCDVKSGLSVLFYRRAQCKIWVFRMLIRILTST